ncbi:hypothetical protein GW17_00027019 [Ensete ventricosum]|nr:hypothetical protein GW17_00027019 [Ensete ventricosum]
MALIDRVHDMSRVINCLGDKITDLLSEIQELKEGPGLAVVAAVERCIADLQGEVEWLKAMLVELNRQSRDLQQEAEDLHRHLRDSQHQLKDAGAKEAIAEYKDSSNFKLELQRSSQVSYEYGYQVVLAQFQDKYPDLEVEENPFTSLPEDGNVPIEEVPFDDSPAPPEV